jgi:hypothetical protein
MLGEMLARESPLQIAVLLRRAEARSGQPTRVNPPPSADLWLHEIKYDGFESCAPDFPTKVWLKTKNKDHPAIQRVKEVFKGESESQPQRA